MKLDQSKAHHERAVRSIPLGAQTLSKTASQFTQKFAPNYIRSGDGPFLYDVDGNRWTDYVAALGPIVLGYNHPEVNEAVIQQLKKGAVFSLSHESEVELAEKLCSIIPGVEKVRFGKNGSDVTAAAVRACRAITGRDHVALCGYHGWQDWYIGTTARSLGVPEAVKNLSHTFNYNQIESLEKLFLEFPNQIGCVIIESIGVNEPIDGFLQKVKDVAHRNGALVVFDEIVNGFRLRHGGGGEYYGVIPDFVAFGKAMGNGIPIAAIGAKREHMKIFEQIFFSFTFAGDVLGVAAALKTIEVIERDDVYSKLWKLGEQMKKGFNDLVTEFNLSEHLIMKGLPHHLIVEFKGTQSESLLKKSLFQQECLRRGELFLGVHFFTLAHRPELIEQTLGVYRQAMPILADAIQSNSILNRLESDPVAPVFRARV